MKDGIFLIGGVKEIERRVLVECGNEKSQFFERIDFDDSGVFCVFWKFV